jgi:hypothetical protein
MRFRSDRRRTPIVQFLLLFTCVFLSGVIVMQQGIITRQSSLIQLLFYDSSQLATLKLQTPHNK